MANAPANPRRTLLVPRAPRKKLGYSIPAAADLLDVPERALRRAVALQEIEVSMFAGRTRIPAREIARLKRTFAEAE